MPRPKKAAPAAAEVKVETPIVDAPIAKEAPVEQKAPVEKKAPAKKAPAKKTCDKPCDEDRKVVIQYGGAEIAGTELVEKAKKIAGIKCAKSIVVYVRPEINKVYYVIDDNTFGNFDLF